jgi:hypothetical protein
LSNEMSESESDSEASVAMCWWVWRHDVQQETQDIHIY